MKKVLACIGIILLEILAAIGLFTIMFFVVIPLFRKPTDIDAMVLGAIMILVVSPFICETVDIIHKL